MREEREITSRREDDKCVDGWMDGWVMNGGMDIFVCRNRGRERVGEG